MAEVQGGQREWNGEEELWAEAGSHNGWFIVRLAFNVVSC